MICLKMLSETCWLGDRYYHWKNSHGFWVVHVGGNKQQQNQPTNKTKQNKQRFSLKAFQVWIMRGNDQEEAERLW